MNLKAIRRRLADEYRDSIRRSQNSRWDSYRERSKGRAAGLRLALKLIDQRLGLGLGKPNHDDAQTTMVDGDGIDRQHALPADTATKAALQG